MKTYTAAHWGIYEVALENGGTPRLHPIPEDDAPSPIGEAMLEACLDASVRVKRPCVRESWLRHGPGAFPERRGMEPFIEVSWAEALDLAAAELRRVREQHGNDAIFGGSYGWSSAGRFHHAQSQVHRFLNTIGGYVSHRDSYSLGAARVLMPHIVAPMDILIGSHTSWNVLEANTRLFVTFGGVPEKNSQISAGGPAPHRVRAALRRMADAGIRFVNISPVRDDLLTGRETDWWPIVPNTDAALLLAIAHTLHSENLHNHAFLDKHCVGFDAFARYLSGGTDGQPKSADWAAPITGIEAGRIRALAREMAATRTMINAAWSLQRAEHGEQPYWLVVAVAAMLGQIGLPGGGFGLGYGSANMIGSAVPKLSGPTLPQGSNPVPDFIPVARLADMLLHPGEPFRYNGAQYRYPDIQFVYWAGGNPFHHHQDLNRLSRAWRKPRTIVVNETFWTATARRADIVLPATTALERDDIGYSNRERYMVAMRRVMAPYAEARDDYWIFSELARRLGTWEAFTQSRDTMQWLAAMYGECVGGAKESDIALPDFATFWARGRIDLQPDGKPDAGVVLLEDFRRDPKAHPLSTPSGKIEIYSERIASYAIGDCAGHPAWYEPSEWLSPDAASNGWLHLISDQPHTRLHSQLDNSACSKGGKIGQREPVRIHPRDAALRGISKNDLVRLSNSRGACLAAALITEGVRPGVVALPTGAWFDPQHAPDGSRLEIHGNPNVLTQDRPSSGLSQGCSAQSCLVRLERYPHPPPPITVFESPEITPG
ncbi:molybdopterin-dependent oxidoreductase [Achromobacter denitrificans]